MRAGFVRLLGLSFAVVAAGQSLPCIAATLSLVAARDATIFFDSDNAFGAGTTITAGNSGAAAPRRALVWFDVAAQLPSGATITSATLTLFLEGAPNQEPAGTLRQTSVHRVTSNWGEGTSGEGQSGGAPGLGQGAAPTPDSATWMYTFYNTSQWSTAGGDYTSTASAATAVGTTIDTPYEWTSSALSADVQAWLDAPANNFGWILLGDESAIRTNRRFYSREAATPSFRPTLTLEYSAVDADLNDDGVVDIFDVNLVSDHWGESGPAGDANGDGAVDIFDVNVISDNWTTATMAVAEPHAGALMLLAGSLGAVIAHGLTVGGLRSSARRISADARLNCGREKQTF